METRHLLAIVTVVLVVSAAAFVSRMEKGGETTAVSTGPDGSGASTQSNSYFVKPVYGRAVILMPAVDNDGNGVVTSLKVESAEGEGRTLVNINQLIFWTDTQYSIQTAKDVAQNYTGYDLSNADIIYTINASATVIEGPSAGAALTVATVAALRNTTIRPDVMITGTVNPDGTIGQVGGVLEKAQAAKAAGATLFLVPDGQAMDSHYNQQRKCRKIGPMTYCTTDYLPVTVDIAAQAGITVKEVSNISEALKYFLG
ncbi:MAG: hypothetical protein NT016_02030 [Candidatus Aenigmarchaeota archaeon]|nr:hypothetical protein [Candidatus Aenigmarchaeota archaeon]